MSQQADQPAVVVTRGGVVESVHHATVVVCPPHGDPITVSGAPDARIYPRSSLKPLQAVAIREQLAQAGVDMNPVQLAMASASHSGSDTHQVEAAALLADANLDESALRCPPSWPLDEEVRASLQAKTTLSHNCSGKHAAMLWAHTTGGDAASYLDPDSPLQSRIQRVLQEVLGEPPEGPGIDGCGAPAWRCSSTALARGFARLHAGKEPGLAAVRDAMLTYPELIGGPGLSDTDLMFNDARVVAKRGADGVMACGFSHPTHGPLGVSVKVLDGGDRAAGPLAAAVLHALGAVVPTDLLRTPVFGGDQLQGHITATPGIASFVTAEFGLS
ncbi:MAG: asparaginase [Euzebya sp.]